MTTDTLRPIAGRAALEAAPALLEPLESLAERLIEAWLQSQGKGAHALEHFKITRSGIEFGYRLGACCRNTDTWTLPLELLTDEKERKIQLEIWEEAAKRR